MNEFTPEFIESEKITATRILKYDYQTNTEQIQALILYKALDEITRLNARVQELEAEQRWIPVGWDNVKVANFWMMVNKTDYCWEWKGSKNKDGYGTLHDVRAHQISYRMFYGDVPEGMEIMHLCNNPSCVNPTHLSSGSHKENMQTMFRLRRYSRCGKSSKYIGVSFRNDSNKWRSTLNKKSLGCFDTEIQAAEVYDKAALEHYGKDAAINFPLPQPPEEE